VETALGKEPLGGIQDSLKGVGVVLLVAHEVVRWCSRGSQTNVCLAKYTRDAVVCQG
jgi:hypothetical protein